MPGSGKSHYAKENSDEGRYRPTVSVLDVDAIARYLTNDNHGSVSPTPQPANFEEFDKLLEKLCPNITFLQYKKLYAASVSIKESSSSDYYGGTTNYAQYLCDLKKLYEALTEIGVIKQEA